MIPTIPQVFVVCSAVCGDTMVVIFTLQTIQKAKCTVGVQLARSIVNGY